MLSLPRATTPRASIVIPVYNEEAIVESAVLKFLTELRALEREQGVASADAGAAASAQPGAPRSGRRWWRFQEGAG